MEIMEYIAAGCICFGLCLWLAYRLLYVAAQRQTGKLFERAPVDFAIGASFAIPRRPGNAGDDIRVPAAGESLDRDFALLPLCVDGDAATLSSHTAEPRRASDAIVGRSAAAPPARGNARQQRG